MKSYFHILLFSLLLTTTVIFAQTPQYTNDQTAASINRSPLYSTSNNKCQWLFAPGDFGAAPSGNITYIYIKPYPVCMIFSFINFTIKIGQTNLTSLSTNWVTGLQTCYFESNKTFAPMASGVWLPIKLQTSINFDASRYLVIEISQVQLDCGISVEQNTVGFNSIAYGEVSSAKATAIGSDQLIAGFDIIPYCKNDAGILSINSSGTKINPGNTSITATLKNWGTDTLKSTELKWSVNGINQLSPPNWTGSLVKNATDVSINFGNYNFGTGFYNLKTWTDNPNAVIDSNKSNDTASLTLISCNPVSGTYIIDQNGTGDFKTFNIALDWIKNCGVSGPVTYRVKPGTYYEQLSIPQISGASLTNTITFESYDRDSTSAILTFDAYDTAFNYVVKFSGADYITFRNLTIKAIGSGACGTVIQFFNSANYNTLCNNIIQTAISNQPEFYSVIYSYPTLNQYNTIKNNVISGGRESIEWEGISATLLEAGNVIEGNDFKDFDIYGIDIRYQDGIVIRNNKFVNAPAFFSGYGIYTIDCANNIDVSGNNISLTTNSEFTNSITGISLNNNKGTSNLNGNVSNNFISIGGTSIYTGIDMNNASYQNITYNSVNIYGNSKSTSNTCLDQYGGAVSSINIRNNIFANFNNGYAIYIGSPASISTSDYNDLYSKGTYLGFWSSKRTNLAAWQSGSGKDANSVSVNPGFYSNTDLHLNTSGISNLGTPVSGITIDIDGESRNTSTPDIGADEFNLAMNDAGITNAGSSLPPCQGINTIKATIRNYGLNNLTSIIVNWKVNGVSQSPDTFSVSLSQYQDTSVTFGTYSFKEDTLYNVKIWTSQPNTGTDGNNQNDTLHIKNLQTALAGIYTIGGASANYPSFNAAVNDLKLKGICSAVIFRIYPGSYNENISIPYITGVSKINTITFESYNLDSTSVDLNYESTGSNYNYVVQLYGADYVCFRQITIRATGLYSGRAVDISGGSDHNTFANNVIKTVPGALSSYSAGVYSSATIDNYNTILNNVISGGFYGIYLYGGINSLENVNIIKNNVIKDFYYYGVYTYYQRSIVIEGNRIQNHLSQQSPRGLYINYNSDSIKILKNRIELNSYSAVGMYINGCNGSSIYPGLIANNFLSQTTVASGTNYGLYISNSTNQNLFNNTVSLYSSSPNSSALYAVSDTFLNLQNNILVNNGSGYSIYATSDNSVITSDYNDLYTSGAVLGYWNGNRNDLTIWKDSTSLDTHSISADPFFYSTTDLHVYSNLLDSAGLSLPVIKVDIDDQPRNSTKPDIGADEFTVYNQDAGIVGLVIPVAPCAGNATNIIVKLKNFGTGAINNLKIKWSVNGASQTPKTFSGNLSCQKDTNIFIGSYTFNTNTLYNLKFWTDTINGYADKSNCNDTLSIKGIQTGISGTFTIGNSGRDYSTFNAAVMELIAHGVCGPVTFMIDPGTYNEQISIPSIAGASLTNTITFKSASNDSTKVDLNFSSKDRNNNYVIELNGADYIAFIKIRIRATSSQYSRAVNVLGGADHITFSNNLILSCNLINNDAVISFDYSQDNYNTIINNYIRGGYNGILFNGLDSNFRENNNVINNNTIKDFNYQGVLANHQNSIEISGNLIENSLYAGSSCYGITAGSLRDTVKILRNTINLKSSYTNYCMSINVTGTPVLKAIIANNSISQTGDSKQSNYGMNITGSSYLNIYNNSVNITAISSGSSRSLYLNYGVSNINIMNNIFSATGDGYAAYITNPAAIVVSDHNDLYTNGPNIGYWGTTNIGSLINWKSVTSKDLNSISIDAPFTSASNLHLANNSYSFFIGKPLAEVPYDIEGNPRSSKNPMIGAYERIPLADDAGICGFESPKKFSCDGLLPIQVILKNYGTNQLSYVTINCEVNGIGLPAIYYTGSLAYLEDTTILIGYYNFIGGTTYKIIAGTQYPNGTYDLNFYNNDDSIQNIRLFDYPVIKSTTNDSICIGSKATLTVSSDNSTNFFWYDSLYGGKLLAKTSSFVTDILNSNHTFYVEAGSKGIPDSLLTSKLPGSSEMGNMFDVKALNTDVIIDSFSVQPAGMSGIMMPMAIYYKKGTYIGNECNNSVWTLLGLDTVISTGVGNFVPLSIGNIKIKAHDTIAFYVTSTDFTATITHTDGAKVISDKNIKISCGIKTFYPFDTFFQTGKTWNGKIFYSTGSTCKSARKAVDAVVNPLPNFTINDSAQCLRGNYFEFTYASTVNKSKIAGYTWDFGDMATNHDSNISHIYNTDKSYIVKLTVATSDGCIDSITKPVFVYPEPNVTFSVNQIYQCLIGNSFINTNKSTVKSGTMTHYWNLGDSSTSTDKNTKHSFTSTGSYMMQLISTTDKGCIDSFSKAVYVTPNPVLNLGNDTTLKHNETITLNAGAGMVSYLWSTNASTQQITIDTTGVGDVGTKTIWVKVEKKGCFGIDTILIHFIHNNAISERAGQNSIIVYPNPATNEIFIESSIPSGNYLKVSILNEYGKELSQVFNGIFNGKLLRADATEFASGIYFIKFESGMFNRLTKMVIIK